MRKYIQIHIERAKKSGRRLIYSRKAGGELLPHGDKLSTSSIIQNLAYTNPNMSINTYKYMYIMGKIPQFAHKNLNFVADFNFRRKIKRNG